MSNSARVITSKPFGHITAASAAAGRYDVDVSPKTIEAAFRRGYHHAAIEAQVGLRRGATSADLGEWEDIITEWRCQQHNGQMTMPPQVGGRALS